MALELNTPQTLGVMVNVLDCDLEVGEFELQLRFYVHFWTNTLGKDVNPLISPIMVGWLDFMVYQLL